MRKIIFCLLIAITATFIPHPAVASGPYFNGYMSTPQDLDTINWYDPAPNCEISSGYPGIIFASSSPRHLFPIYRSLIGKPLSLQARQAILGCGNDNAYTDPLLDAINGWKNTRQVVTGTSVDIATFISTSDGFYYTNCLSDAFNVATQTLQDRQSKYSQTQLAAWISNQDSVFAECGQIQTITTPQAQIYVPTQAPSTHISFWQKIKNFLTNIFNKIFHTKSQKQKAVIASDQSKLFIQDKAYQEAAKAFYNANFESAANQFQAIAKDSSSPWQNYAALVLGRTYIRQAELSQTNEDNSQYLAGLQKAQNYFQSILKDPNLSSISQPVNDYLDYINTRLNPQDELLEVDKKLLSSNDPQELTNSLDTLNYLIVNGNTGNLSQGGDFSQWIDVWTNNLSDNFKIAYKHYSQTKSLPWLLALLRFAKAGDNLDTSILDAANRISPDSVGYWTMKYYYINYLIASGKTQEAQNALDNLGDNSKIPPVAQNYINDLRMRMASNISDLFSFSQRNIAYIRIDNFYNLPDKSYSGILLLDNKAKFMVDNLLPINALTNVVNQDNLFTPELTKNLRLITMAKAFILGDYNSAENIAALLASNDKVLAGDLQDFINAQTETDQKFTGAVFFLRYPGISSATDLLDYNLAGSWGDKPTPRDLKSIDNFRQNWWACVDESGNLSSSENQNYSLDFAKKLLTPDQISQAQKEDAQIYSTIAPDFLGAIINNYALSHLNDNRMPEVLSMVVDATHFAGCQSQNTTKVSAKAFKILHTNYPNNYWAKQTPYYY